MRIMLNIIMFVTTGLLLLLLLPAGLMRKAGNPFSKVPRNSGGNEPPSTGGLKDPQDFANDLQDFLPKDRFPGVHEAFAKGYDHQIRADNQKAKMEYQKLRRLSTTDAGEIDLLNYSSALKNNWEKLD